MALIKSSIAWTYLWKNTKKGNKIERDGETLHWCKDHVHTEGLRDNLYMLYKSEDPDQ